MSSTLEHLANLLKGGRVSGWVGRNIEPLREGGGDEIELGKLLRLSPRFARETEGMSGPEMVEIIREALEVADQSPLSATNFESVAPDSMVLIRKLGK